MSGNDILARVRRAVHMADSLHAGDVALAEQLLHAAESCRKASREFLAVLERLQPATAAAEAARTELLRQLSDLDCGDKLLHCMLDSGAPQQSDIHTQTPPGQLQ